jgi:hypothetical protein
VLHCLSSKTFQNQSPWLGTAVEQDLWALYSPASSLYGSLPAPKNVENYPNTVIKEDKLHWYFHLSKTLHRSPQAKLVLFFLKNFPNCFLGIVKNVSSRPNTTPEAGRHLKVIHLYCMHLFNSSKHFRKSLTVCCYTPSTQRSIICIFLNKKQLKLNSSIYYHWTVT